MSNYSKNIPFHSVLAKVSLTTEPDERLLIIDVGANVGQTLQSIETYKERGYFVDRKVDVLAFEPNMACEMPLRAIERRFDGIKVFMLGLGTYKGEKTFYMSVKEPFSTGNSMYLEQTKHFKAHNSKKIRCDTLDNVLRDNGFQGRTINLLKIDTQGSELDILDGARESLLKTQHVLLEVSFLQYNKGAPLADSVIPYMEATGFRHYQFIDWHYLDVPEFGQSVIQADILFSKE